MSFFANFANNRVILNSVKTVTALHLPVKAVQRRSQMSWGGRKEGRKEGQPHEMIVYCKVMHYAQALARFACAGVS